MDQEVKNLLRKRGIKYEVSTAYCPQQNGFIERENRTIVEAARTMLKEKSLPTKLWGEAVRTACYVLNQTWNKRTKCSPYEGWFRKKPNIERIRVFGSDAYALIPGHKTKWESKSQKLILVGYNENKSYRLWNKETNKIESHLHVIIHEATPKVTRREIIGDSDEEEEEPAKQSQEETTNELEEISQLSLNGSKGKERSPKRPNGERWKKHGSVKHKNQIKTFSR